MDVVVAQLDIVWEDKPANHQKVRELLAGADIPAGALVVLPEMFDTGFSMNPDATAQTEQRESEAFLRELAEQLDCAVLAGVVGPKSGEQASNEAVAFGPNGNLLVRYRKMQPFALFGEDVHYGRGDQREMFTWQGIKIAPFICYDLRFPEVFRPAAQDGAELICVMANWPEVRSEHWVRLLQARAIENQAYVIGVNRCGADPEIKYDGRTCGFDPHGQLLGELDGSQQTAHWTIDAQAVRQWREQFPALRDIRS